MFLPDQNKGLLIVVSKEHTRETRSQTHIRTKDKNYTAIDLSFPVR
jgi:hypothetical protein